MQKVSYWDLHQAYFWQFGEWQFGYRVRIEAIFQQEIRLDEPSVYDMFPKKACRHHLL